MKSRQFILTLAQLLAGRSLYMLVLVSTVGIASGLANAAIVALIQNAVGGGHPPAAKEFWVFLGLCLLVTLTRIWSDTMMAGHCQASMSDLVSKLIARVVATPLRRVEEIGPARILAVLTQDVQAINGAVQAIPKLLLNGAILVGCGVQLARVNPIGALILLPVFVFAAVAILFMMRRLTVLQERARGEIDRLMELFRGHTAGIKELQLNADRRDDFLKELCATMESYRKHTVKIAVLSTGMWTWFQLQFLLPIGVLVFFMAPALRLPFAAVGAYALVLLYMNGPIVVLATTLVDAFGRGRVSLANIQSLGLALDAAPAGGANRSTPPTTQSWSEIDLVGVTHSYVTRNGETPFVLGPLNLLLRRGEIVFITGGNGSGKTTLAKLLCGLYAPDAGVMCVDGEPMLDKHREAYRQECSAIFSDFHIFRQMFGLQRPGIEAAARERLREFQLDHKVDVRDGCLTTINLSQGQRKRLALLVSILEDRQICIFDEWAAEQDAIFREYFYKRVLPELRILGKTVLVVSHDERYTHVADRIIKLEYGQLISDVRPGVTANSCEIIANGDPANPAVMNPGWS